MFRPYSQKGFVVIAITFFVLLAMILIALGMSMLVFYRQRIATNMVKSTQSYYAAEAGLEDALMLLANSPQMASTSYALAVGGTTANVTIPTMVGGSRTLGSQGDAAGRQRKLEAVYSVDSEGIAFHYGVHVGEGGLAMSNGSKVEGNVFSNGNITGSGTITNNAVVATNGNKLQGPKVQGNVLAYSCFTSVVEGSLTYVSGGSNTCSVAGSTSTQSDQISPQPLPITQSQIDSWKSDAAAGGVTNGNVTIANNQTQTLGPQKIVGNLTISNNATLKMTGTVHVVGNIVVSNNAKIQLDASYGSLGGVIIADGQITPSNNSSFAGSGQTGSYLLVLSTSSSGSAISISNNATGAIFYANNGTVVLSNNVTVKELVAYKISMSNNSIVKYESGLANLSFTSGPSGSWRVLSWEEK